jgi:hypothetical protein
MTPASASASAFASASAAAAAAAAWPGPLWRLHITSCHTLQVSAHPRCIVRLSIMDKGPGSNDYFKVNGIAVVPYGQPYPFNWVDSAVLARENIFNDAYKTALVPRAYALRVGNATVQFDEASDLASVG